MKWPFVPEKWQYKQSLAQEDKTNLKDMISERLPELLAFMKASILAGESVSAASVVFLVDRFLYWVDASSKLLQIAKALHRLHPGTPLAPQLVLRQARLSVNTGKLQKAEYILSSLINNSGATGSWVYHQDSDRVLVQAVSTQIRGQILQKLGLWREAAELILASLVGFYALPQPDKKGIGTSLGLLANILASMNDTEYEALKTSPHVDLSFMKEQGHRLLSAAEAAKLAVIYSQFAALYVLTNAVTQGTCLLSYSFSTACPPAERTSYLTRAKEAFEIGLLTKKEEEVVTSKQELHTLVKAAFSLTVTHKWLGVSKESITEANRVCQEAMEKLYSYSSAVGEVKEKLSVEIMKLIRGLKTIWQVQEFLNSDEKSFIPDSYKQTQENQVAFGQGIFQSIIQRYSQYHTSVCEAFQTSCKEPQHGTGGALGVCITALKTATEALETECATENAVPSTPPWGSHDSAESKRREFARRPENYRPGGKRSTSTSLSESLGSGSSWLRVSEGGSSFGWEDLADRESSDSAHEGKEDKIDTQCSTDPGEDVLGESGPLPMDKLRLKSPDLRQPSISTSPASIPKAAGSTAGERAAPVDTDKKGVVKPSPSGHHTEKRVSFSSEENHSFEMVGDFEEGTDTSLGRVPERRESSESDKCPEASAGNNNLAEQYFVDTEADTADDFLGPLVDAGDTVSKPPDPTAAASPSGRQNCTEKSLSTSSFELMDTEEDDVDKFDPDRNASGPWKTPNDHQWRKSSSRQLSTEQETGPKANESASAKAALKPGSSVEEQSFFEKDTEEDEGDQVSQFLDSSLSSSSSFLKLSLRSSFLDSDGLSALSLSGDSFVLMPGWTRVQMERERTLGEEDYKELLSGVTHARLLERLKKTGVFKPRKLKKSYSALQLKYSKVSGLWTARETKVYIGASMGMQGKQRTAFWIQFLHQEEMLARHYVGKEYQSEKELYYHLNDVERQMTAQYYITEFNKRLYEKRMPMQIYFIPSEVLLILEDDMIKGCVSVEPYMQGDFVKLTNNKKTVVKEYKATDYGIAFGHFTYEFSGRTEIVVDLQGWITGNGKGLTYLTDPQIHSLQKPKSASNFNQQGIKYFLRDQHGEKCNEICHSLALGKLPVTL
ncbi:ALPK1 kinase, partial [Amia calva]|nr:ALPK1 kinase [Amia calva]